MKLPPRWLTVFGLLVAITAAVTDPSMVPFLAVVLGANASAKLAAFGALLAAVGRAIVPPSDGSGPSGR